VSPPPAPSAPLPSKELAARVGVALQDDTLEVFDALGQDATATLRQFLPSPFAGHRLLDFGCGVGKVLRHLLPEAETGEVWGCDIDPPSIAWLRDNLVPPLHVFVNDLEPPLRGIEDGFFDVVFASSVFTHITDAWARWLLELHRVLRPGGVLVATYLGSGMSHAVAREPWDEDRIGMNVLRRWQGWGIGEGGPAVLHSPWWLRAHWGRMFDVELIDDARAEGSHGLIVVRRRRAGTPPTVEELEALEPGEPRELAALRHNIVQLEREAADLASGRHSPPASPRAAAGVLLRAGRSGARRAVRRAATAARRG
jgi:SAM-dependent methyltransferase